MTTESLLAVFRYDTAWLTNGFVTEELLRAHHQDWQRGDDQNTEHYRWAAFRGWIESHRSATDADIRAWLMLCEIDPHSVMADSMLASLQDLSWLTDDQFEMVVASAAKLAQPWMEKRILGARFRRERSRVPLNDELFEMGLRSGDTALHEILIDEPSLTVLQLEELSRHGANRGIRAKATEKLKRGRRKQ